MKEVTSTNQIDFKFADPVMNHFAAFVVERFTTLDQKVNVLDTKVNNLDQKVGTLDNKVNNLDQKIGTLDNKVNNLDKKVGSLGQEVNNMGILMERMDDNIQLLVEGFKMHSEKLDLHTDKLEHIEKDVKYMKDVMPAYNDMIHENKKALKKLEHKMVSFKIA